MGTIEFLREGLRNLKTVGTVTRSSKWLCRQLVREVPFAEAKVIVELGAGDGVITHHILEAMDPDARLLAFEVNRKFCDKLRTIGDPRLEVIEDSAEHLGDILNNREIDQIDAVISAIPFVALPDQLGKAIISACHQHLKKEGLFVQVHYSLLAKHLYEGIFGNVGIRWVPLNVPPAFVLVSRKNGLVQDL